MKKIKLILSALILSSAVFSVSAQREQNSLREIEERNTNHDNWFVSIGGSANILMSEQDQLAPFKDRISYGGALSVGKWFNPFFGARIQGNYGGLKGANKIKRIEASHTWYTTRDQHSYGYPMGGAFNDANGKYREDVYGKSFRDDDGHLAFWQKFNYATASVDLMGNLSNLMRGRYKEGQLLDIIPFVGVGWIHAFDNDYSNPDYDFVVARLGVRFNFNLTRNFAIYLEPQVHATEKEFDGYAGTAFGDAFSNLSLGIQYTFNKRYDNVIKLTADEIDRLNNKINANRYLIENQQDILERQQGMLDRLQKCCDENKQQVVTQVIETNYLPDYVRFGLDSYKLEPSELRKIAEMTDYLKRNPNSKILLVGYADRQTGNPRYNLDLSQKRVNIVQAEFKRLGINENRMTIEWKGDKEQPFPQNEWNRVVVIVERK